jgi:hypothetical protein
MPQCSKCGKELKAKDGGFYESFNLSPDDLPEDQAEAKRLMGNYLPGKEYRLCPGCHLEALGVVP